MYQEFFQTYVKCKGFSDKNKSKTYQEAKEPYEKFWNLKKHTYEKVFGDYLDKDIWIGAIPKYGIVVVDADTPAAKAYVDENLNKFNNIMRTKNGYHLYFKMPKKYVAGSTQAVVAGFDVTFRTHKNFLVIRSEAGERQFVKTGELQALPEAFTTSKSFVAGENLKYRAVGVVLNNQNRHLKPETCYLEAKLRTKSTPGNKHFARYNIGLEAGNYRLKGVDYHQLVKVVRELSAKPDKAEKDFSDGFCNGERNTHKVWRAKAPSAKEQLDQFFFSTKQIARNIKNTTLRTIGITPNSLGVSELKRVEGEVVRLHAVADFDELKNTIQEQTRLEQIEQYAHTQSDETDELAAEMLAGLVRLTETLNANKPPEPVPEEKELSLCDYVRKMFGLQEA